MLAYSDFNSIKVRLEHSIPLPSLPYASTFQFHKGTIRTNKDKARRLLDWNFNSIKVRLELPMILSLYRQTANFNSIKVRLEHSEVRPGSAV